MELEVTVLCERTQIWKKTYVSSHMLSPNLKCVLAVIWESRLNHRSRRGAYGKGKQGGRKWSEGLGWS